MTKSPHAFRSIGEVARLVGVATHVLRYWETQFPALAPVKRADGRRYYRLDDVLLTAGICEVLREEGLTIRGARRLIAQDKGAGLRARGRLRLGDRLGLDEPAPPVTDAASAALAPDAAAMPVAPALASPPGTAATRSESVSARRRQGRAPVAIETLPLFPELETGPQPAAPFVIDGAADGAAAADWLARLCATAAGLRLRETPLPDHASDLAAALRAARAALDHGVPA